jgi:hypothetical protein
VSLSTASYRRLVASSIALCSILASVCSGSLFAGTVTAASVSYADVAAAVSAAVDGDTVVIPAGTADWTTNLPIKNAITLQGAGAGQTIISDSIVGTDDPSQAILDFSATGFCRLTGITFQVGNQTRPRYFSGAIVVWPSVPSFRIDHCDFYHLRNKAIGVNAERGVVDHNTFEFLSDGGLLLKGVKWGGGDLYGDTSWAQPLQWGGEHAVFIEDNTFTNDSSYSDATNQDCTDSVAGARWVFRHNTVTDSWIASHGTETSSRDRGHRSMEVYDNTFTLAHLANWFTGVYVRSGTAVIWGNSFTGSFNNIAQGQNYRDTDIYFWGGADGVTDWDLNDTSNQSGNGFGGGLNGVYASGAHTGTNGSQTLTVAHANWATDQWRHYTIRNLTTNRFSLILSNTSDTITYKASVNGNPPMMTFDNGQRFEIRKVIQVLDHPGGSTTDLLTGDNPTPVWLNQTTEPIYLWNNVLNSNSAPTFSAAGNIVSGRDYQDNTQKPGYTPYVYPHPLVSGVPGAPADLHIVAP